MTFLITFWLQSERKVGNVVMSIVSCCGLMISDMHTCLFQVDQHPCMKLISLVLFQDPTECYGYDSDKDKEYLPDSSSSDSSQGEATCRPKRGRKSKYGISRQENKMKRNRNEGHFNYKGLKVRKDFQNFVCNCTGKCHETSSVEFRRQQFVKFWELGSYDAQTTFIAAHVSEQEVSRRYGKTQARRTYSRTYRFGDFKVCRGMFVHTLSISTKRVDTALKKVRSDSVVDKRGKKQGAHNKISQQKTEEVVNQINKIPKYTSHYRRERSDAEYLPPGLTLQEMYEVYKAEAVEPVSFSTYRRIFLKKFNLKFKHLKKDTCNKCDIFAAKIAGVSSETDKQPLKEDHKRHIDMAEEAQHLMKNDMKRAKDDDSIECLSFDMEKTLPLPRIPTNIMFYKRQLWLYNCGIHGGKNNKGYCYVWTEGTAGRGAQEVGSCLLFHIQNNIPGKIEELVLWSDSCGGQNRNIKLTLMLKSALDAHSSLKRIRLRFLVSGHSFLANDSDFSDIESALKHQQRIYLPDDYIRVMKSCRKKNPLVVTKMTQFLGTQDIEKMITNRKVDTNKEKISWLQTREILLEKEKPCSIFLRTSFSGEFSEIDIQKRQTGRPSTTFLQSLSPLWSNGKPIPAPKLQDLRSVMDLIPGDARDFYSDLLGASEVEDDVDGFSGLPDFECE